MKTELCMKHQESKRHFGLPRIPCCRARRNPQLIIVEIWTPTLLFLCHTSRLTLCFYFFRANGEVVLGGTGYHNNFDTKVSADDTRHILEVTSKLIPSLKVSLKKKKSFCVWQRYLSECNVSVVIFKCLWINFLCGISSFVEYLLLF